MQQSKQF